MDKTEALIKIKQMSLIEKITRLSETDLAHIQDCIEQVITDEKNEFSN